MSTTISMEIVPSDNFETFDTTQEIKIFSDHIAPNLDVYEQAIYLYLLRNSHLKGTDRLTIGLKSARHKIGFGAGDNSKSMSESTLTLKIKKLAENGMIKRLGSDRKGTRLNIIQPSKTEFYETAQNIPTPQTIEELDFFSDPIGRAAILEREEYKCFYCFINLDADNHVMEHVQSRPEGKNTYQNIVAACTGCNNKKSDKTAENHLRNLYREGLLSEDDLQERLLALKDLKAGCLLPILETN